MIPILDGAYNPDPRLRPKVWNRPPSWPMPPNGTVGISLAADDENTQQDLFFWTDPRMFAVNRKGPTAMGSLVYDMAGGGFIDTTRGARLQSALWVVKEPYGGANSLALNIHDTGCGDAKGGLVIELPYDAGTVTSDTRILAELSHHRGGFIVSGCPNDWHNRGADADGRPINGAHISLHTNLYHKPTIDGPMLWEGPWLPGDQGDKVVTVHFSWDAAIRHYRWYSWKDTYTPDVPTPPTWGGGNPGGGTGGGSTTTAGGNFVGDDPFAPVPVPGSPAPPTYPYSLNPELFQGLSPFPFNPNDPPIRPTQPAGPPRPDGTFPADPYTNDPDLFPPTTLEEENDFPPDFAPHPMPGSRGTTARVVPRLHEWRDGESNRPFTASSKEFASSAFLGRPQMAALNVPDFRNWNHPSPRMAQQMDNVTPVVATLAAYGEQVGSQWVYNQRPRQSRYLGGTAQGGFVMLPPEVGIDSFGDTFQPTNIGTISKPYFTMGPGARLGFGPPDLTDGTVDNGWSFSNFLNSEVNLDPSSLLRGNDLCIWQHASAASPAFAFFSDSQGLATLRENFGWKSNTNFWGVIDHANTANRLYTFPDADGTVALVGASGSLTAGRVVYVDASGQLTTDAGFLFNDSTDTMTAAILNLTAATSMIVFDSDAANTGTLTMGGLSSSVTWTLPASTGSVVLGTASGVGQVAFSVTNANTITTDAGLAYDSTNDKLTILNSSTNVTPMLEVEQASTGDTGARFTLTGGNSFMLGIDNSDSDKFKVSYGSAGNAALGTNDYLTIGTDGKVGIGTASPNVAVETVGGSMAGAPFHYETYRSKRSDAASNAGWGQDGSAVAGAGFAFSIYVAGTRVALIDSNAHILTVSGTSLVNRLSSAASTETVFNEQGADIDHRIEGDNKTGCLTVDASDDEVVVDGRFSTPALTPTILSANQDNYNPESTATNRSSFWRLSSDASRNITGIANGLDGRHLWLVNVGSNDIVIQHQNASSDAANRIITQASADVTMGPSETMILIYDATTQRWRSFEDA